MKTVEFLLITLKIASAFLISQSLYKIYKISNVSLKAPHRRIPTGMAADKHQFPFMVVLVHILPELRIEKCTSSLLKANLVLTAAHCTRKFFLEDSIVVGGEADYSSYFEFRLRFPAREKFDFKIFNVQERWPSEFISHPDFGQIDNKKFHDIALVRMQEPFTLPNITTIPLSLEKMKKPMKCTILGWGLTTQDYSTTILHYAHAVAKTPEMGCAYMNKGPVLCLERGNVGTCFGDSGSPLVCDNKVWGVAAFITYLGKETCDIDAEDYYTEIYSELEWLNNPTSGRSSVVATSKNTFVFIDFCILFLFEKLFVYL